MNKNIIFGIYPSFRPKHKPVLQFGLALYLSEKQMITTAASSTAFAIASNIEPAEKSRCKTLWNTQFGRAFGERSSGGLRQ